ncbi:MAG: hypothetical protein U9N39_10285 [Campylobacterota bacterium]|nr:hypothetical protein [Campylobacterota bacterium]
MDFNGLSIDQAPPISAPLRFFLTAPIFGIIAGVLMLLSDTQTLINRYSIDAIIITHALTIGVFAFVIFGALTQMLPVLTGTKVLKVKLVTTIVHIMLVVGLLSMVVGLKFSLNAITTLAYIMLGGGFTLMILSIANALRKVANFTATVKGMTAGLVFAFFITILGVMMLSGYADESVGERHVIYANIHSVWAIFGFCGLLIIGVAFQVLPMFYVAPHFKQFCKKRVVFLISTGLLIWLLFNSLYEEYALYAKLWIATFFWAFATAVWFKFNKRKRPISDVTVWYWRAASVFLTLGAFLWIFDEFFKHEYIVMVAILIGGGFILSIMLGMLYKIVPFLVWFHLNAKGYMSMPTVNEMIDKGLAKIQFVLLILSLIGFIFAFYMPKLLAPSASFFIISMLILEYNILSVAFIYKKTLQKEPDFDMSEFAGN